MTKIGVSFIHIENKKIFLVRIRWENEWKEYKSRKHLPFISFNYPNRSEVKVAMFGSSEYFDAWQLYDKDQTNKVSNLSELPLKLS